MRARPLAPLAGLALLLAPAAPCDAGAAGTAGRRCSCMRPEEPGAAREGATAVFLGTVVRDSVVMVQASGDAYPMHRVVTLAVDARWKGTAADTVHLATGMGGGDCGYGFMRGGRYLVFAYGEPARLSTGICTLTRPAPGVDSAFRASLGRSTFNRLPASDAQGGW